VNAVRRARALLREALVSALAQPVGSVLGFVMVAGMCAAVLLTSGRTVAAEQQVVASIDSTGTRAIVVRAEPDAGLDVSVLDRLAHIDGIEWAGAFGLSEDARNTAFPDGAPVALRRAWSDDWAGLGLPAQPGVALGEAAYASDAALAQLGMAEAAGGIAVRGGTSYAIAGRIGTPEHLAFLEPLVIAPQSGAERAAPVGALVVIATRPELVAPLTDTVRTLLDVTDPDTVEIRSSEALATLRGLVGGQLGAHGRALTLGILGGSALLVAVLLFGMVTLRRKDFGRRRALGASQRLIVALVTTQTAITATAGAAVGSAVAAAVLWLSGDPVPEFAYLIGVDVLGVLVATLAALLPALSAARREPIAELRVP